MSEFHSIIYYFKKHLLSIYYAPGTILDIRVRKADMVAGQMELLFQWAKQPENKQTKINIESYSSAMKEMDKKQM